jgi:hypothetical protein
VRDTEAYEDYTRPNGVRVRIYPDENPISPGEWDCLGTLYLTDRNYGFAEHVSTEYHALPVFIRAHRMNGRVVVPVRFNDHGSMGGTIYATDDEDANGYIVADPKEVAANLALSPTWSAEECLRGEIKEWDMYVRGDVYGYVLTGPEDDDRDALDSCWGFYGDIADMLDEVNSIADSYTPEDLHPDARASVATFG